MPHVNKGGIFILHFFITCAEYIILYALSLLAATPDSVADGQEFCDGFVTLAFQMVRNANAWYVRKIMA